MRRALRLSLLLMLLSLLACDSVTALDDFRWRCSNVSSQIHIKICGAAPAAALSAHGNIDGGAYFQGNLIMTPEQDIYCVEWTIPVGDFAPNSMHDARLRFCDNFCANIVGEVVIQFGPVGSGEDVQWFTSGTNYPGTNVQVSVCLPTTGDHHPCRSGKETTAPNASSSGQQSEDGNQNAHKKDPVNLGNGATFFEDPDLQPVPLPGETLSAALAFGRFQSSGNPTVDLFYGGWTHNYNVRLADLSTEVRLTDWQGNQRTYTLSNSVYNGDGTATLTKTNGTFIWQLTHGTRYTFDILRGYRLTNITDRVGSSVALRYDLSNLLTGIADSAARQLALQYNVSNQLVRIIDPLVRTNTFDYETLGRLKSVSDALGTNAQYVYGDAALTNAITRLINARGYTNIFVYNALGQATSETNALGKGQTFTWTGTNQQVAVVQFDGTSYTNYNNISGAVTARVDAAGTTKYFRDDKQRLTNLVDRLTFSTKYRYDTNGCACALSGNLLQQIDALDRTNSWTYESTFNFPITFTNAAGGVTLWSYDTKGNVLTNTDAATKATVFEYDGSGNLLRVIDANTHTNVFAYDGYGNRTNVTDALSNATTLRYDLVGRLTNRVDALTRSETFTWDDRDRLTRYINGAGETNRWVYDGNGNRTAWTNELGYVRAYGYDALDRLTSITLPASGSAFLTFGYDDANNRTNVTDALGHTTMFGYDALGRLSAVSNALNKTWSFAVDAEGRRTRAVDPNSHTNSFVYDAVGQLTGWTNALTQVTTFGYNKLGNLSSVTDPRNNALTFSYDAVSRLTNITYAGSSTEKFFYDNVGNLTGVITRAAQQIALTYDTADRLTQKSYVGTNDVINFSYDAANQLTGVVAAVSGGSVTSVVAFAYDSAGRLTNEIQTVAASAGRGIGYEYYADGRRKKLIYPDATWITYDYNSNGWLTAINDGGTNAIVTYEYDAAGRRTKRTLANNTFTVYDYDSADQLTNIWHRQTTGSSNTVSRYQYGYDDAGNRTNMVGTAGAAVRSESYSNDAQDQLTGVTYKGRISTFRGVW